LLFQDSKILSIWSFAWDASVKQHPTAISHFTALEAFVAHSSSLRYTGKRLGDQQFQVTIQTTKEVRTVTRITVKKFEFSESEYMPTWSKAVHYHALLILALVEGEQSLW
jgi:hypothetical protein